jgi:pimeloyl-ACP methyl ester carboxylesterase
MNHLIEVAPNVKLNVVDWGEGKPLVFIAGWPFDHRSYEYQFTTLSKSGFRCIGIDMRGYGFSDKPWGEYNYDIFAQDIHKVLEKLKVKDAVLIGHSTGGAISMHYTALYQNIHVTKLILVSAAAPMLIQKDDFPYGAKAEDIQKYADLCDKDRAKLLSIFGTIFFRTPDAVSPELSQWFWITGMEASPWATVSVIKLWLKADLRSDMPKIKIPTIVAHAIEDKICPYDLGKVMHEGIANSTLVTYEKSGHALFYDEREKFNQMVIDFANKN